MGTLRETAVAYVRVSTPEQASEGFSLAAQQKRAEAYALAKGWQLTAVFADEGISALKSRPSFDAMIHAVRTDEVGHVIVTRLDRAGRSALELLRLYETLEGLGTSLVSIEEGIDTSTPVGRFLRTILAAVAELERDMVSERTKAAMAEAAASGVIMGRPTVIPKDVENTIVALRREGTSYPAIAKALADAGVEPPSGLRWYPSTIARVCARRLKADVSG